MLSYETVEPWTYIWGLDDQRKLSIGQALNRNMCNSLLHEEFTAQSS